VSGGVKVTDTLQLLPGASVFSHSDLTANTGGHAFQLSTLTARRIFFLPAFVIVTVLGALVFPTFTVFPNASEWGLMVSFAEVGVGVAVGV